MYEPSSLPAMIASSSYLGMIVRSPVPLLDPTGAPSMNHRDRYPAVLDRLAAPEAVSMSKAACRYKARHIMPSKGSRQLNGDDSEHEIFMTQKIQKRTLVS
jgi:hypothetical protein